MSEKFVPFPVHILEETQYPLRKHLKHLKLSIVTIIAFVATGLELIKYGLRL